jgi:hypothetical protein
MKTITLIIALLILVATACGDDQPADTTTIRSEAYVESVDLQFLESYPVQVRAIISGNLPTPCHRIGWEFDALSSVAPAVIVYSTVEPDAMCAEVLEPFEITIDLGSFETGDHVAVINGATHPFTI